MTTPANGFARESIHGANTIRAVSILILCGAMHADFLKQILEESDVEAEANHELQQCYSPSRPRA